MIRILMLIILTALSGVACAKTASHKDMQRLMPDNCVPVASSSIKLNLTSAWQPYLFATRVCPLTKQDNIKPEVLLVTIFIADFYRDKPDEAKWENFPKPILVKANGAQVGEIAELFPEESPGVMVLTYGKWQANVPSEIRMHIINPAVTGDYNLPTLVWNKAKQQYLPQEKAAKNGKVLP